MAEDAETLVLRGVESRDLDYKGPGAWDSTDKKGCCELVKDILALANTAGGTLVVGVRDRGAKFTAVGLTPDEARSWDSTKINQFVQNYADPPINVTVRVATVEARDFVLLTVPRFMETPHICQKQFPGVLSEGAIYVRTANNASAPISNSADMRLIIEQAVRTRQSEMLEAMRAIMVGAKQSPSVDSEAHFSAQFHDVLATDPSLLGIGNAGFFTAAMWPGTWKHDRYSRDELRSALVKSMNNYRGYPFAMIDDGHLRPTVLNDGLRLQLKTDLHGQRYFFWEARTSGLLIESRTFAEDGRALEDDKGRQVIGPSAIVDYTIEAVDFLVNFYSALDVQDEDVTLGITLSGTNNRALTMVDGDWRMLPLEYVSGIPEIVVRQTHALEDWRAGKIEHAAHLAREILLAFSYQVQLDTLRRRMRSLLQRRA